MASPRPLLDQVGEALAALAAWEPEGAIADGSELFRGLPETVEDFAYALRRLGDTLDEHGYHPDLGEELASMGRYTATTARGSDHLEGMFKNLHEPDFERMERDPGGFWDVRNNQ